MRKILLVALSGFLLATTYNAAAVTIQAGPFDFLRREAGTDRKEARKQRKEARKARREAYRHEHGRSAAKSAKRKQMRDNYRQRKQMDKASRQENRRSWGSNKGGDVFSVY